MKRKNLMTAIMCATVLSAATVTAPMTAAAEEAVTEAPAEAETETGADEQPQEDTEAEEEGTEAQSEENLELLPRPDYQASDYVTLGEYKGLTVSVEPVTVTDDEIIGQIRANAGSDILEEIADGTVEEGDTANIDYEGKLDGEAFDGGTAKDYDLEIGSGSFIDGFEDGLIGVKAGETIDLPLTFPENYTAELAGKDVVFTVTVNAVKRMPELTSELVSDLTDGEYSDVDAYKESIRSSLEAAKEDSKRGQINNDLIAQIASNSEIKEYPPELIDYVVGNMTNYYKQMAKGSNMAFDDFLDQYMGGLTEVEFNDQAVLVAQQNVQAELYLKAIAEAEGIEISDDEYEAKCQEYADTYGYSSVEEFKAAYDEGEIRISALGDKVFTFLTENAVIEEKTEEETEEQTDAEDETDEQAGAEDETEEQAGAEDGTEEQTDAEDGTEVQTDAEEQTEALTEAE